MKKIIKLFSLLTIFTLCLVSCDIETSRPLTAKVTINISDLPDQVGAIALYCNLNEWKASEVMAKNETFIADVTKGKATFVLKDYTLATPLKFQFTPLPSRDTKMGDDWWGYAISGSSSYSNQENNLYIDFLAKKIKDNCVITLSQSLYNNGGQEGEGWKKNSAFPCYGGSSKRMFNSKFTACFDVK